MSSSTSAQNVSGSTDSATTRLPISSLAALITRQEFDFTRFGEKSYFVIFQDLRGNSAVGKVGPSTKLQHVMHYLCDAWGYPQTHIIYAYMDALRIIHKGLEVPGGGTFGDLQFERDGSDGNAEVVFVTERLRGC